LITNNDYNEIAESVKQKKKAASNIVVGMLAVTIKVSKTFEEQLLQAA
jgi:HPt (histidine-containing phosphotransfer) domain-containing protein